MSTARWSEKVNWVASLATRDFCPWANRYVYWLKEPVGWFVIALAVSVLVGMFLSPLGWSVAAGLAAVLVLGLGFPWLATRTVSCGLKPVNWEVVEQEATELELTLRNRLPVPLIGLMIENYLSIPGTTREDQVEREADCGLARVPPLSTATYRLPVQAEYRGIYPATQPTLACSFPFGIWTARAKVQRVQPLLVRPLYIPILSEIEWSGTQIADTGHGQRPASHGDFIGVRQFRRGDSLRSIHWAQSARYDELIVCERGGPQQQPLDLHLSTSVCQGSLAAKRENLAWRVRIVASFVDLCIERHCAVRLWVDGHVVDIGTGGEASRRAAEQLALVPLDSTSEQDVWKPLRDWRGIHVSAQVASGPLLENLVKIEQHVPATEPQVSIIDLDQEIATQLDQFLVEVSRANSAA